MHEDYVVVATKPWNRRVFEEDIVALPGRWHLIDAREQLNSDHLASITPRFVFFLHWSWMVPAEILDEYECICFHMADLPHGRGGSPLQNLILSGHRQTKLSAFRMIPELDAGPVYLKEDLSLEGLAEEIYIRSSRTAVRMMSRIIEESMIPVPQDGQQAEIFRRRVPEESEIPARADLEALFDFIRMLDAEGYPSARLEHQGFRYEFTRPSLRDGRIHADVRITPATPMEKP
jgi:methionyl-tRNA formyltransferase